MFVSRMPYERQEILVPFDLPFICIGPCADRNAIARWLLRHHISESKSKIDLTHAITRQQIEYRMVLMICTTRYYCDRKLCNTCAAHFREKKFGYFFYVLVVGTRDWPRFNRLAENVTHILPAVAVRCVSLKIFYLRCVQQGESVKWCTWSDGHDTLVFVRERERESARWPIMRMIDNRNK